MKSTTRVNITNPVTLRRLGLAQDRVGETNTTRLATRFLDKALDEMGVPIDAIPTRSPDAQPTPAGDTRTGGNATAAS